MANSDEMHRGRNEFDRSVPELFGKSGLNRVERAETRARSEAWTHPGEFCYDL
jgi:hypothetical protein